jgi:hypothetical protein
MEMLETKKATKTEFYFHKIQTLFLLVVQPKWKEKKTNSIQKEHHRVTYNKTKQNRVHKEHHKVVGTKERKQFANLVTPKNLTD